MSLATLTSPAGLAILTACAFVWSLIATHLAIKLAHRYALHAVPDHRSSHTIPTPRIGGVAIAGPPLIVLLAYLLNPKEPYLDIYVLIFIFGATLFFASGLVDDLRGLDPKTKIRFQIYSAIFASPYNPILVFYLFLFIDLQEMPFGIGFFSSVVYGGLWIIWTIGFVNAYNFMDGMNGKAGGFAVAVLVAFCAIVLLSNQPFDDREFGCLVKFPILDSFDFNVISAATLGALLGFLYFNCRTNAPIFLGDSGSHLVGYLIAALAFYASDSLLGPGRSLLAFTIVLIPFIYDVAITLVKRARAGEKVWEAHRGHLYQRLMVAGYSHMRVLGICLITYIACGALGVACAVAPDYAAYRALMLLLALLVMAIYHAYVLLVEARTR